MPQSGRLQPNVSQTASCKKELRFLFALAQTQKRPQLACVDSRFNSCIRSWQISAPPHADFLMTQLPLQLPSFPVNFYRHFRYSSTPATPLNSPGSFLARVVVFSQRLALPHANLTAERRFSCSIMHPQLYSHTTSTKMLCAGVRNESQRFSEEKVWAEPRFRFRLAQSSCPHRAP